MIGIKTKASSLFFTSQVNSIKTKELDCHEIVRIIATSGDRVEMVISRNALASLASASGTPDSPDLWTPVSVHRSSSGCSREEEAPGGDRLQKRSKRKVCFELKSTEL